MTVLVCTTELSAREREEAWRAAVAETFVPLDFTFPDPRSFRGEISSEVLGTVSVARVTAGAHRAERTQRQIARIDEAGYYKVSMPLRGQVVIAQDGREATLQPGDLAIYDTSRPYRVCFAGTCRLLVLMFPRRDLRLPRDEVDQVTARPVSGRTGIGGLVAPLLANLADRVDEVGPAQSARLADNVVDLLGTLYADLLGQVGYRPADPARTLVARIRSFVEGSLDDPDLGPETVAAACHISVGYLHKLFRTEGTSVSRLIRERRLEQCRRDLISPGHRYLPVGAIGVHWGFLDAAHFSKVFKAAYGVSPSEYRRSRDRSHALV
jgi:AraC-like DNA-binding protein